MNRKVLIVEDDRAFIALIELSLRDLDFEFDAAREGQEAMALLTKRNYDLIISDFRVPGVHGLDILKFARQQNPDCQAVLISSANKEMFENNLNGVELLGFIQKPFSPIEFREMITGAFEMS